MKPVLRYHGAKWKLRKWVLSHFPQHRIYLEAYGGSAAILLAKPRSYAEVYCEADPDVRNFFRVLRDPAAAAEFERICRLTPFSDLEFQEAWPSEGDGPIERARKLVVRSYMGHGSNSIHAPSGFRRCSNRSGSTPAQDWSRWPDRIAAASARFKGVVIEDRLSAVEAIDKHDSPETLHYVDPPYVTETRTAANGYRFDMVDEDHRELAGVLHDIQGMAVLSGYPSSLYDELYDGWKCFATDALGDGACKRTECLWLNPLAAKRLEAYQQPLFATTP